MPVAGTCIQAKKETGRGLSSVGVSKSEGGLCGGNLALTVSEGAEKIHQSNKARYGNLWCRYVHKAEC